MTWAPPSPWSFLNLCSKEREEKMSDCHSQLGLQELLAPLLPEDDFLDVMINRFSLAAFFSALDKATYF